MSLAGAGFVLAAFLLNPLCGALSLSALSVRPRVLLHEAGHGPVALRARRGARRSPRSAPTSPSRAPSDPATAGMVLLSAAVAVLDRGIRHPLRLPGRRSRPRSEGLFSIPAEPRDSARRSGVARACHALVLVLLVLAARALGARYRLLDGCRRHRAPARGRAPPRPADDLSRVPTAFFQINVLVSVVVMIAVVVDLWIG